MTYYVPDKVRSREEAPPVEHMYTPSPVTDYSPVTSVCPWSSSKGRHRVGSSDA